ncbi:Aste57867_3821 [Aphanomyces stellatus]|uniref:Aste57867_3821 protein n=1 Tax=Aphanomyces stellatus TaxID=120398 RepID=A0A485KEU7_9STRA|nr:hypothetical protein As57867_003810 [Aphanomyces stellatus]VFT80969.1 Aste57867_3821 [Aphanomyces stellatus]
MGSRSAQLTKVYNAVLGFDGSEFYLSEWPECVGLAFNDVAERFNDAIPIGIKTANGQILIKPRLERTIHAGDEIIVLAEDNDTYKAAAAPVVDVSGVTPTAKQPLPPLPQRILLCGWHRNIRDILILLDHLSAPETYIHLVNAEEESARVSQLQDEGLRLETLKNLEIKHFVANTAVRRYVEELKVMSYECILVMADRLNDMNPLASDSHVIATVMLLRVIEMSQRSQNSLHEMSRVSPPWTCIYHDDVNIVETKQRREVALGTKNPLRRQDAGLEHRENDSGEPDDRRGRRLRHVQRPRESHAGHGVGEPVGQHHFGSIAGRQWRHLPATRYCEMNEHMSFWALAKRARLVYQEIICGFVDECKQRVLNPPQKHDIVNWGTCSIVVIRATLKAFRSVRHLTQDLDACDTHPHGDASLSLMGFDVIPVDDFVDSDDDNDTGGAARPATVTKTGGLRHVVTSDALLDDRVRARVTRELQHSEFNAAAHRPPSPLQRHRPFHDDVAPGFAVESAEAPT